MASSLGSLVVSLGLDAAAFTTGLSKSEAEARKFAQTLDRAITTGATVAGAALVVLGGAALGAFAAINNLARKAGNFQDLADKTGATAEAVASYAVALNVTGKAAEDLAHFSVLLSKNLAGVQDGTNKAGAALQALGLDVKTFKALDPAAQIDALAKALGNFSNIGGGKAAVIGTLVKDGASLLPFFKELNEEGGRSVILTEAQIKQADEYADAQARAKEQLILYAQVIAIKALPAITALTGAAKEFIKELINVESKSADISGSKAIENWADSGARAVAFLVDAVDGVGRAFHLVGNSIAAAYAVQAAAISGEFSRAVSIAKDAKKEIDAILERPLFSTKLESQIANRKPLTATPDRPKLSFDGAIIDSSKNILDGQIKALEAAIAREKDVLNARADYLQDYFKDGFLSVADYYGKLQQARDEELANVIRFYDAEIAVQQQFRAKAKSPADRQDATNKIADIQEKQNKLLRDAATLDEKTSRERNRAAQEYADQLDELNAKMLDLAGNTAAAAAIRFDVQNRLLLSSAKASGDTGAVAQIAALKKQQEAQAGVNDATRQYSLTLGDVSIQQAKIDLLLSTGAITEIDAINKRSSVAAEFVQTLLKQADAAEAAANKLQGMDKLFALQNVDRFRLEIEQLAAASDALAKKFNDIGSSAFSTFLTDLIDRTKSVKQAFLDMAKSIEQSISKIAAQNISETLFKKDGPLGGFGSGLASLFRSNEKVGISSVSGVGADAVITSLSTAATAAEVALGTFTPTVATAEVALGTFSPTVAAAEVALGTFTPTVSAADLGLVAFSASLTAASEAALASAASASGGGIAGIAAPLTASLSAIDAPALALATSLSAIDAPALALVTSLGAIDAPALSLVGSLTAIDAPAVALATSLAALNAPALSLAASLTAGTAATATTATTALSTTAIDAPALALATSLTAIDAAAIGLATSLTAIDATALTLVASMTAIDAPALALAGTLTAIDAPAIALAASMAAINAPALTLVGSLTAIDPPALTLVASLTAAALAADAFAAAASVGGIAGSAAKIIDFGGFFAGGGDPPVGKWSLVGEHGPEAFIPKQAGTIIPLDGFRGAEKTTHIGAINITVPAGTSRASADQIAAATATALRRATARTW